MKMGNDIAYLMPTKCKIFLGKGRSPFTTPARGPASWTPAYTSLTDCPSHNSKLNDAQHVNKCAQMGGRKAAPQYHFWWQLGKVSHSGNLKLVEALVEMVYKNWEFITKLCEFYPWKQVFLGFQNTKTHKLPGAPPPGPPVPWWNLRWKQYKSTIQC